MAQPLVPTEVVQKLLEGSYEQLARRIESAVTHSEVFGEFKGKLKIIGTFGGYAIAVSENAKFVKVLFECAENGEVIVVGSETLDVPVLESTANLREFFKVEARSIAESFISGSVDSNRIKDLMLAIDGETSKSDEQIVATMIEGANADRPWKFQYDAKEKAGILQTVLEGWSAPEVKYKFTKLYDGSMTESEVKGYTQLVKSDLTKLVGDLDGLMGEVQESFATLTNLIETGSEVTKEAVAVDLKAFINDLLGDLMGAQHAIAEALEQVTTVSALGKLHDALAEGLAQQKAAGQFIFRVVGQMASPH